LITIDKIIVTPIKVDRVLIAWEFTQTLENFHDYSFELQRSRAPETEFETIFKFLDESQFLDEVNYKRLWANLFYKIKITHNVSGKSIETDPTEFGYAPNLEALEIIRRNDILLKNKRHGIGVPVIVFLRKRQGIDCECWDRDKKRPRTSNCTDCYGGRFLGGFSDPIVTWANPTPDRKSVQIPQYGEQEQNESRLFFSNYPILTPKDLVLDPAKMILWTVEGVETSERRGHLLHQLTSVSFVDRSSVYYKLIEKYPDVISNAVTMKNRIEVS
jgi:hypothetical protein